MLHKQLRIEMQKKINNYQLTTYLLDILLANKNYTNWFYENFIQLYFIPKKYSRYDETEPWLDFYEAWTAPYELLNIEQYNRSVFNNKDIIKFVKDCINNECYFFSFIDKFFSNKKYNKSGYHFVHDVLLYGYDDEKSKFKYIGFDEKDIISDLEIDYSTFETAFYKGLEVTLDNDVWKKNDDYYVTLFRKKYNEDYQYKFDISKFQSKLYDYIYSINSGKRDYPDATPKDLSYLYVYKDCIYGMDIYDGVLSHVRNTANEKTNLKYVLFHTLSEHKTAICERLFYISEEFHLKDELNSLIENYRKVENSFSILRFFAIKYNSQKKESILSEMIKMLEDQINYEKDLLLKAYGVIEKLK